MNNDLKVMKLHVDDAGTVWSLFSDGKPRNTGHSVVSYMTSTPSRYPAIRMMGCKQNAHLILGLYARRLHENEGVIEVCSPAACATETERHDPERVLLALRQMSRSVGAGGWHTLSRPDQNTYMLISQLQKVGPDDNFRRIVKSHMAWPAISFVSDVDITSAGLLLAEIVDPRWYVDSKYPGRGSKLRAYLGLDLKTMTGVLGKGPAQRLHARCKLVYDTWFTSTYNPKLIEYPNNFLRRVVRFHKEKGDEILGILRASQMFIEYVRLTWLATFTAGRTQLESLFIPEYFFNDELEIASYKSHIKRCNNEQ